MRFNVVKNLVLCIFLFKMTRSFAASFELNAHSKAELCEGLNYRHRFQDRLLRDSGNRLAFRNLPGPLGRGLCWWHSRFTRNALYLMVFRPDLQYKLKSEEAEVLIEKIISMESIVEIPGFRNLNEFSNEFKSQIDTALSQWSLRDAFSGYISNSLIGDTEESPERLQQLMDELFVEVEYHGRVVFQTLQLPGLSAHSWLVVDIVPTLDGYEFKVIDSNYLNIQTWQYHRGQKNFIYSYLDDLPVVGQFVPYINDDWKEEENHLIEVLKSSCPSRPL